MARSKGQCGAVWLTRRHNTRRLRRAKRLLRAGDQLDLYYNPKILQQTVAEATLLFDGGDFSVWNKPYGMRSQGSKWGDHTTLYRQAERQLLPQRSAFNVHRLDRAAQGLMLLAHSKTAATALSKLFRLRQIHKVYRAMVHGLLQQTSPATITTTIDGKTACSHVTLLELDHQQQQSLVEVTIESGRKHQIRRHLSEMGHPIRGDRLYGSRDESVNLMLCSCEIAFTSPFDGTEQQFRIAPPWT